MLLDLLYSEDIDIKDLEKYFLASSQGQASGLKPKNFITLGRNTERPFRVGLFEIVNIKILLLNFISRLES